MRLRPCSVCVCASIALSAPAWAQAPAGAAFRVNTYTTGRQVQPHIGMMPGGDFVVVWDHTQDYPNTLADVHARRFTAGGVAVGAEFRVNAFTTSTQSVAGAGEVARDAAGNTVVVWTDFRSEVDVFARRVSAAGAPLGDDFMANQTVPGFQALGRIAVAPDGRFVVVWDDLVSYDVFGRRYDAAGNALGGEFRVNAYTTDQQRVGGVAIDGAGNFTVAWYSYGQDAPLQAGIFGQRFDASGQPMGAEFQVNTYATGTQRNPVLAMGRDGAFVVAWEGRGRGDPQFDIWARRYSSSGAPQDIEFRVSAVRVGDVAGEAALALDEPGNFVVVWGEYTSSPAPLVKGRRFAAGGAPRGDEFLVASPTSVNTFPKVGSDAVGNFAVAWHDASPGDREVFAQRFGGLQPTGLMLSDAGLSPAVPDGGNGVLEVGESFALAASWRNLTGAPLTFRGGSSGAAAPPGLSLTLSSVANYGTVANGATGTCVGPCFAGSLTGTRPAGHVDATFVETIEPDEQGQAKRWALHVGDSFTDVPRARGFYGFVETLLHRGVTGGCGTSVYCPTNSVSRDQMAVFVLAAKEAVGYAPPACTTPVFADVQPSSPFCRWIEELARRGVTGGCGGGNYCPAQAVTREQMAVFVLRTLDPALDPPACEPPNLFNDVPETSAFCRWIEELARRGVVSGCGGGDYCPAAAVTREQMSVFLVVTFGLILYGP